MITIYCHTNTKNDKKYVGQTKKTPAEKRWSDGMRSYSSSKYFYNSIKKNGWDNFEHSILETCETIEEANIREQFWIKELNTLYPNGYNLQKGGNNHHCTDYTKSKLRKKMGEISQNPVWKQKVKEGTNNFFDSLTPEDRLQKMHRDFVPEQIRKRNNKIKEHNNLPEVKKKISEASKMMWKNMSEEERQRRLNRLKNGNLKKSKQQCSEASRKGWITRKTNQERNS